MSTGSKSGSSSTLNFPSETTSLGNPITHYKNTVGKYPSNSEIWWAMKRPPDFGADAPPKLYLEVFDPGLRHQVYTGGMPAPKGHFILNAFHQDRSGASGVPNIPVITSGAARPRAIAFFAGRVWYAGVNASDFSANVYFSPVIEKPGQVGQCYQQYDPTSEELRDLLPSDGGVVVIPELAIVYHMDTYGDWLLLFSNKGVWAIGGSESGGGFKANDYTVKKVSGVPSISNMSFVNAEGIPVWWNRSSINAIALDPNGQLTVRSLSDETIKQFYDDIPEQSKFNAKGTYDPLTKTIQWLYRSTTTTDQLELYVYDRILTFDARTDAFSPWSLNEHTRVKMHGVFAIAGQAVSQETRAVLAGDDSVLAGTDNVISLETIRTIVESRVKYIVNVLDDTLAADETPDGPDPVTYEVVSDIDNVLADLDNVVITT